MEATTLLVRKGLQLREFRLCIALAAAGAMPLNSFIARLGVLRHLIVHHVRSPIRETQQLGLLRT